MPRITEAPKPSHKTLEELRGELQAHKEELEVELARTYAAIVALTEVPEKRKPGRPRAVA